MTQGSKTIADSLPIVPFITQKAVAHDTLCEVNYVVSSIPMYNLWRLL